MRLPLVNATGMQFNSWSFARPSTELLELAHSLDCTFIEQVFSQPGNLAQMFSCFDFAGLQPNG